MWKSLSVALIVLAAVFEVSDGKLRMLMAFSAFFSCERCGEGNVAKNNREVTIVVASYFSWRSSKLL